MRKIAKLGGQGKHAKSLTKYNQSPKFCKRCSALIPYEDRRNDFCSHTCAALYNNARRHQHKDPRTCNDCGCVIKQYRHEPICGKCQRVRDFKYRILNRLPISHSAVRKYLITTRGHTCEKCKLTTWNNLPIPLDSHHKDGDYLNNNDENLELLCKNCHAQTDNYGSKNKGNGSERRRIWRKRLNNQGSNINV